MRECVLGSSLSAVHPDRSASRPADGLQAAIAAAGGIAASRYEVAAGRWRGHHVRRPIVFGDNLRRTLLRAAPREINVERLKLVAGCPLLIGCRSPPTARAADRIVDGEHAAITAKKMGIGRSTRTPWPPRVTAVHGRRAYGAGLLRRPVNCLSEPLP